MILRCTGVKFSEEDVKVEEEGVVFWNRGFSPEPEADLFMFRKIDKMLFIAIILFMILAIIVLLIDYLLFTICFLFFCFFWLKLFRKEPFFF